MLRVSVAGALHDGHLLLTMHLECLVVLGALRKAVALRSVWRLDKAKPGEVFEIRVETRWLHLDWHIVDSISDATLFLFDEVGEVGVGRLRLRHAGLFNQVCLVGASFEKAGGVGCHLSQPRLALLLLCGELLEKRFLVLVALVFHNLFVRGSLKVGVGGLLVGGNAG